MPEQDTAQQSAPWVQPTREELLTQIRKILVDHPERHDQSSWLDDAFAGSNVLNHVKVGDLRRFATMDLPEWPEDEDKPICGTTGCIAGWAGILGSPPGTTLSGVGVYGTAPRLVYNDGTCNWEPIAAAGQRLLELDDNQAAWMFHGDRDRQDLIDAIDLLLADPDAELDPPRVIARSLRVVVIDEADGTELWSRSFTNERDREDEDWDWVEEALSDAHQQH